MTERLTIASLAHRGDGIVDTPAGAIYVPYTLPGEIVTVEPALGQPDRRNLLAVETASRSITVNCIAPGMITTAMTDKLGDEQRGRIMAAIPMGRFGIPDDIAAAAIYLASAQAGYITGQTLHINGGMVMP